MRRIIILIIISLLLTSCNANEQKIDITVTTPLSDLEDHVMILSSREYEGRLVGTEGNEKAVEYISDYLLNNGFKVELQAYEQSTIVNDESLTLKINGQDLLAYHDFYVPKRLDFSAMSFTHTLSGDSPLIALSEKPSKGDLEKLKSEGAIGCIYFDPLFDTVLKSTYLSPSRTFNEDAFLEIRLNPNTVSELKPTDEVTFSYQGHIKDVIAENVIAYKEGLSDETIIISAHLDHVGATNEVDYFPGALDNASGISILLELSDILSDIDPALEKNIVLAAFNGEEEYLYGSIHYANNPIFPLEDTTLINLDMVGSDEDYPLTIAGTSKGLIKDLEKLAESLDIATVTDSNIASDHIPFMQKDVESITLIHLDMEDIHSYKDDLSNYSSENAIEVLKLIVDYLEIHAY